MSLIYQKYEQIKKRWQCCDPVVKIWKQAALPNYISYLVSDTHTYSSFEPFSKIDVAETFIYSQIYKFSSFVLPLTDSTIFLYNTLAKKSCTKQSEKGM